MKKIFLRAGFVVEVRNGKFYVCMPYKHGLILVSENGYCIDLDRFTDNLNCKMFSEYDIIRVWGYSNIEESFKTDNSNRPVIWDREKGWNINNNGYIYELKINEFAESVHEIAIASGLWNKEPSFTELIAMCHLYLSKALEQYNSGEWINHNYCLDDLRIRGISGTLADLILHIIDICKHYNVDIEYILRENYKEYSVNPNKFADKII